MEQHVVPRHRKVVHHAVIGQFEPYVLDDVAGLVDDVVYDIARQKELGSIAEGVHFTCLHVDLRMCGERLAREFAVKIPLAYGLQCFGVHRHRPAILLQRQQHTTMQHYVCVGSAAHAAFHARVVGQRIAIGAEQRPPCLCLQLEFFKCARNAASG
jgi:hypothetical protein